MSSPRQGEGESSPPNLCLLLGSSLSGLSGSCHALEGTSAAKVCMAPVPGDRITFLFTLSAESWSTLFDAEEENQCWFLPNASSTEC